MYADIIEKGLEEFKTRWNSHSIRPSRMAGCPCGVPDDLYNLPEMNGNAHITCIIIHYNYSHVANRFASIFRDTRF